jgi:hypothetical protein
MQPWWSRPLNWKYLIELFPGNFISGKIDALFCGDNPVCYEGVIQMNGLFMKDVGPKRC